MLYAILLTSIIVSMFAVGFFIGYWNRTDFYERKREAHLKRRRDKYRERKERYKRERTFSWPTTEK